MTKPTRKTDVDTVVLMTAPPRRNRWIVWHGEAPSHFPRLLDLVLGAFSPPPGRGRIVLALACGVLVHTVFTLAVVAMMAAMYFGMSRSFGAVPWPYAALANLGLLLQFPLAHSFLLSARGQRLLARLVPGAAGAVLGTTTFAFIASLQLLLLFAIWTPTGVVWWRADGFAYAAIMLAYVASWLLLIKATYDAGMEVQSGALGWLSLLQNKKPVFPGMPERGLFRIIRHPIYVAFALTLWTVPVWTPDQLFLAVVLTSYCLLAPKLKERRLQKRYGDKFNTYRKTVPYAVPGVFRRQS